MGTEFNMTSLNKDLQAERMKSGKTDMKIAFIFYDFSSFVRTGSQYPGKTF